MSSDTLTNISKHKIAKQSGTAAYRLQATQSSLKLNIMGIESMG